MKCRRMKIWKDTNGIEHRDIVWFGSYGIDSNGKALRADNNYTTKFVNHYNYATEQEGVVNSLTQRLSVIKGELWWQMDYGLPLFNNFRSKGLIDADVVDIVLEHSDILEFTSFDSSYTNHNYVANFTVLTTFGSTNVNI